MASGIHWRFWQRGKNDCGAIEPLLSLYVDGMATAVEARRVEAHLPGCPECRQALQWMQATHQVIIHRPVASPPADLCARIARAIAEADAAKAPVAKAPALAPARPARRPMTLRPALGYGLSVALFAAASGALFWADQRPVPVHVRAAPAASPLVATRVGGADHSPVPKLPMAFRPQGHPARPLLAPPGAVVVAAKPVSKFRRLPTPRAVPVPAPETSTVASNTESRPALPRMTLFHAPTPHTHNPVLRSSGEGGGLLAELPKAVKPSALPTPKALVATPPPTRTQVANVPASPPPGLPLHVSVAVGSPTVTPDQIRVASYAPPASLNETLHRMVAVNLAKMENAPLTARSVILNGKNAVAREAADVTSSSSGTVAITDGSFR